MLRESGEAALTLVNDQGGTMTPLLRRPVFAFALGAALTAAFLVGRAAHATDSTINACFKPSNGTLYLLGEGTGRTECQPADIPISWNTEGVNGQDGVSVTSESLAPGDDPACPNGGSKFTAANGISYACNGANGQNGRDGLDGEDGRDGLDGQDGRDGMDGRDGVDGQDGEDFSGTFTSPNGQFRLVVGDSGVRLRTCHRCRQRVSSSRATASRSRRRACSPLPELRQRSAACSGSSSSISSSK